MFFIKVILFIMIGIQTNTFYAQEIADPDKLLKKDGDAWKIIFEGKYF